MALTFRAATNAQGSSLTTPFQVTVNVPAGVQNGDLLVTVIQYYHASTTFTPNPAWTYIEDYSGSTDKYWYYIRTANNEPANYVWTFSATAKYKITCFGFAGSELGAYLGVRCSSYRTSNNINRCAELTGGYPNPNGRIILMGSAYSTSSVTSTAPAQLGDNPWTEHYDTGSTTPDFWLSVYSTTWSGSGTTGNIDITLSTTLAAKQTCQIGFDTPIIACSGAGSISLAVSATGSGSREVGGLGAIAAEVDVSASGVKDYVDVGSPAIATGGSGSGSYTIISQTNPASADAVIDCIEVYAGSSVTREVGFFRLVSGTNFTCIGSSGPLSIVSGLNVFTAPADFTAIQIQAGDYIGIFPDNIYRESPGGMNCWYASGDQIPSTDVAYIAHATRYSLFASGSIAAPEDRSGAGSLSVEGDAIASGKRAGLGGALSNIAASVVALGLATMIGVGTVSAGVAATASGVKGGRGAGTGSAVVAVAATGTAPGYDRSGSGSVSAGIDASGVGRKAAGGISSEIYEVDPSGNGKKGGAGTGIGGVETSATSSGRKGSGAHGVASGVASTDAQGTKGSSGTGSASAVVEVSASGVATPKEEYSGAGSVPLEVEGIARGLKGAAGIGTGPAGVDTLGTGSKSSSGPSSFSLEGEVLGQGRKDAQGHGVATVGAYVEVHGESSVKDIPSEYVLLGGTSRRYALKGMERSVLVEGMRRAYRLEGVDRAVHLLGMGRSIGMKKGG